MQGPAGALVGGLAFILPGLALIIVLAALFLGAPPEWVRGIGAGAGAVVAAVAVQAGASLVPDGWRRAREERRRARWVVYLAAGATATVLLGPWLVLVLLGSGAIEVARRRLARPAETAALAPFLPLAMVSGAAGIAALAWTAFKVGALSYGGGFVIIPLMQSDAVERYGWMTDPEFLNAVALGQATPGPVVQTVAVVGYAAAGVPGALLASVVAFAPSFWFVGLGARRFDLLRTNPTARAFLDGAGPAAIGAIIGSAVPLALALSEWWQLGVLAAGAVALLVIRTGVVWTLLGAAAIGMAVALAGGPIP